MNRSLWRQLVFHAALLLALVAQVQADVLTRGPYLQMGTDDSMTVRWRTDVATASSVDYGTVLGALTATATDPAITTEHSVRISGLSPDPRYYYALLDSSNEVLAGNDSAHFSIPRQQLDRRFDPGMGYWRFRHCQRQCQGRPRRLPGAYRVRLYRPMDHVGR